MGRDNYQHILTYTAMSFSFGFSGDDVEDDNEAVAQNGSVEQSSSGNGTDSKFVGLPAAEHSLDDLVGIHTPFQLHSLLAFESV